MFIEVSKLPDGRNAVRISDANDVTGLVVFYVETPTNITLDMAANVQMSVAMSRSRGIATETRNGDLYLTGKDARISADLQPVPEPDLADDDRFETFPCGASVYSLAPVTRMCATPTKSIATCPNRENHI